ncbi:MAG: response regulator transcription factor [Acidimicrobiia bacterium]|nr:response regulator transcription factor [Acidimicrobiia bacterium]
MSHILIVEDERHLADGLRFNLEADGYDVSVVEDGEAALDRLSSDPHSVDLIVLDVMLPGIDGFAVASELRRGGNYVPILMLTARNRPEDVLRGFEMGADDYLPKPFELSILLARVNGLLRRRDWSRRAPATHGGSVTGSSGPAADRFVFAGKVIDFDRLELRAGDRHVPLTLMEASLLRYLVVHAGKPVSRKTILENVWGLHEDTDTRAIDNFIVRLRRYIEDKPAEPKHLLTVRGVGYRFVVEAEVTKKTVSS